MHCVKFDWKNNKRQTLGREYSWQPRYIYIYMILKNSKMEWKAYIYAHTYLCVKVYKSYVIKSIKRFMRHIDWYVHVHVTRGINYYNNIVLKSNTNFENSSNWLKIYIQVNTQQFSSKYSLSYCCYIIYNIC